MATPSKEDVTVRLGNETVAPPAGARTIAEAANAAAEVFAPDEIEKHAQALADAWMAKLTVQTKAYTKQLAAMEKTRPEAAEPITMLGAVPYQWWNLILAGPFQAGVPTGPFLPRKIINTTEACFFLVALWRNPAPLGGGPSAANVMSAYNYRVWLQSSDITTMTAGPNTALPSPTTSFNFGGGFINIHTRIFPAGSFTGAVQGRPELYEMNALVDILGPGPGLPAFAGYSTWVLDPDTEPPFAFPFIRGVGPVAVPGVGPRLQHDTPARFMIYV